MSELGDKLKMLRGSQSQRDMADALGIKYQQWAKYERGEVSPGADMLKQICLVHACSADWLLGLPERGGSSTTVTGNFGAVAVGAGARASVDIPRAKRAAQAVATGVRVAPRPPSPADCANCKYKRLADAFKAL